MRSPFTAVLAAAVAAMVLVTISCKRTQEPPVAVIVVCDLSASIEPEARTSMFNSVELIVRRLRRGDSAILIPATGDSVAEAAGHIVRFESSAQREVFDEDLIRLGREARETLEQLAARAQVSPSAHTDLLGAMQLASEEAAALPPERRVVLIVLSDFIEDNANLNFNRNPALARVNSAKSFAADIATRRPIELRGAHVYLGLLRSHDFGRLGEDRRNAIREFWREYLVRQGMRPEIASDGPGLIQRFLDRVCGKPQKRGLVG